MNETGYPKEQFPQNPQLSVVMSVFNGEPYLREAVDSVLNQTFEDFEFVIVDDCSTDTSVKTLESYDDPRIVLLYNPTNIGLTRSLNRALSVCRGEIIARQDQDDVSMPSRFNDQLQHLARHPEIGVLGTQMEVMDERGEFLERYELPVSHAMIAWQLFFGRSLAHPTVMMRRTWIEKAGGYDVSFPYIEDFELWTRLVALTRIENLSSAPYKYRRRSDSISSTKADEQLCNIISARRVFAARLLESEPPRHLLEWLHYSQLPENQLTPEQRIKVISFILSLKPAMQEKGIIKADEAGEIDADMLTRLSLATGFAPPAPGPAPSRYEACIRPFRLVAKAVANPRRTRQVILQRTGDLLTRLSRAPVPVPEPAAAKALGPGVHPAEGVTVIVLTYQRRAALAALLRSLLQQKLGSLPLELIVCNNAPGIRLKPSRFSSLGRLFRQFANLKIFNSSYNWRCRVRYAVATLAAHDTVMFIDDDITLLDRNFIRYMYDNFRTLGSKDLLSCWNSLWVDWNEDNFSCASLTFETPGITQLTQTDTIGPGICMFNKALLLNARILDLSRGFPKADDMAFPLVAAVEWGSRSYFLPSYKMLEMHYEYNRNPLYTVPGHSAELYAQFKGLLKEGYQPVLSRNAAGGVETETPERDAAQRLPAMQYSWR
ncbi:MAG: glycosyltransferase [Deltaproteobacteria bacterium]|nr:glycosyltransferase [Deltaproteobacteria bacterium]